MFCVCVFRSVSVMEMCISLYDAVVFIMSSEGELLLKLRGFVTTPLWCRIHTYSLSHVHTHSSVVHYCSYATVSLLSTKRFNDGVTVCEITTLKCLSWKRIITETV